MNGWGEEVGSNAVEVVRAVAQRHGAAVTLENAPGGGLLVSCLLAPP